MATIQDAILKKPLHDPERQWPLWRNRDYLVLWSGQIVSSLGTQVSRLAFPLLILASTHSPAEAGLLGALGGLPFALFSLPIGALVDRWDRKRLMILSDVGRALALGSIPLALLLGHVHLLQLALVMLIVDTLGTFFGNAEAACLPHVVGKAQLTAAVAQNQITDSGAAMVGPGLGGVLYSMSSVVPFLADGISYIISACSLLLIKKQFQQVQTLSRQRLWVEIKDGLDWLWSNSLIRLLALLTAGLNLPCMGFALILIVLAQHQHATTFAIGLLFASGGVGSIIGAALANPLQGRFGVGRTILGATWVWALTWPLYALAPNTLILGLINCVTFIVVPIYTTTQYGYRLGQIPDALQGRVNSVFRLIAFGGEPLSLAVTGTLLQLFGPVITVLLLFIPQLVVAVVASRNPQLRQACIAS